MCFILQSYPVCPDAKAVGAFRQLQVSFFVELMVEEKKIAFKIKQRSPNNRTHHHLISTSHFNGDLFRKGVLVPNVGQFGFKIILNQSYVCIVDIGWQRTTFLQLRVCIVLEKNHDVFCSGFFSYFQFSNIWR